MTRNIRYEDWKAANPARSFTWADYAHFVLQEREVPGDFALAMAKVLWPRFIEVEECVFLAEHYSEEKALSLQKQGLSNRQVEYWLNLFSVDGFFHGVESSTEEDEEQFAQVLVETWRAKLRIEFPGRTFVVEAVRDDEAGDLCVTLQHVD